MIVVREFAKVPDAVKDYPLDWGKEWLVDGDTIATSTWDVPSGLNEGTHTNTTTETVAWISGGTLGQSYVITNTIVTANGRTDQRSILIRIR